jgi:predicted kinase
MPGLACHLLNTYLEETGDYESVSLLSFYKSYRAMVRCKVALFTMAAPGMDAANKTELANKARSYLQLALSYTKPSRPFLCLTQGLSGSGKTTLSNMLMHRQPCIRVRSDVERKRLAGLTPLASSGSPVDAGIYAPEISQLTYQRLLDLATILLQVGHSVIVDATFLKVTHRKPFIELARNTASHFAIAACSVADSAAKQWLAHRSAEGKDAAEADYGIMLKQKDSLEEFTPEESLYVIPVRMDDPEQSSAQLIALGNALQK